jgi:hypothetical protein
VEAGQTIAVDEVASIAAVALNLYFNGLGSRAQAARDASAGARQAEA